MKTHTLFRIAAIALTAALLVACHDQTPRAPASKLTTPAEQKNAAPAANLGDVSVFNHQGTAELDILQWRIHHNQNIDTLRYRIYNQTGATVPNGSGTISSKGATDGFLVRATHPLLLGPANQIYLIDLTTQKTGKNDNTTPGIVLWNVSS